VGGSQAPVQLTGAPAQVTVEIDQRASRSMLAQAGIEQPRRVFLSVQEIESEQDPGVPYGMYVNLPEGAPPDTAASHYAGALSFFGATRAQHPKSDEPPHSLTITHDITRLSQALGQEGQWDGQHVTVTFRPIGLVPPEQPDLVHAPDAPARDHPPVRIGRVSVFYA
jgi:tyrosinase